MFWQAFHVKARQWNWGCWKKGSYTPTLFKSIAPPSYMKQNHAIVTTPSILPPDLGCIIGQCREGKLVNTKVKWFVTRIVVLWFTTWYLNNAMKMLSTEVALVRFPNELSRREISPTGKLVNGYGPAHSISWSSYHENHHDHHDHKSHHYHQHHHDCRWYHGSLSRSEATRLLQKEKEGGVFLVRDSTTIKVLNQNFWSSWGCRWWSW